MCGLLSRAGPRPEGRAFLPILSSLGPARKGDAVCPLPRLPSPDGRANPHRVVRYFQDVRRPAGPRSHFSRRGGVSRPRSPPAVLSRRYRLFLPSTGRQVRGTNRAPRTESSPGLLLPQVAPASVLRQVRGTRFMVTSGIGIAGYYSLPRIYSIPGLMSSLSRRLHRHGAPATQQGTAPGPASGPPAPGRIPPPPTGTPPAVCPDAPR